MSADIRAVLNINEKVKPNVDVFLDRIYEGEPFCTMCSRPLNIWNDNYLGGFMQIGYKCSNCKTQIKEDSDDIRKSMKAEIRKDFDNYWNEYTKQINELTGGKPDLFEVPSY